MSFKKELLKVANEVREEGITVSSAGDLLKRASDVRIAYLLAVIKK